MELTALQIHGQAAWKLYVKSSADGEERIIEDLAEVRAFMDSMMRPAIRPENIYAHHHEEQDVVLWYNRALWHCVVSCHSTKNYELRLILSRLSFQIAMGRGLCINAMLRVAMIQCSLEVVEVIPNQIAVRP